MGYPFREAEEDDMSTKWIAAVAVAAMWAGPASAQLGVAGEPAQSNSSGLNDNPAANPDKLNYNQDLEKFAFEKSGSKKADLFQERQAQFLSLTGDRRKEAMAVGIAARKGQPIAATAEELSAALEQDLADWRDSFRIPKRDWKAIRDQMMDGAAALSPSDLAQRRASWVQASDKWIAEQRQELGLRQQQ